MVRDLSPSLEKLSTRIRAELVAGAASFERGALHFKNAGTMLREAKRQVKHGDWTTWLAVHCEISDRSARVYMQVAKHWPEIEAKRQSAADLSLSKALALIAPVPAKEAPIVEVITPQRIANPRGAPASEAFSMAALNVEVQETIARGKAVLEEQEHKPGGVMSLLGMAADYVASFAPAPPLLASDAEAEALEAFANAIIEAHQDAGEDGEQLRDTLFEVAELLLLCEHPVRWAGYLRARGKAIAAESSPDAQTMKLSGG